MVVEVLLPFARDRTVEGKMKYLTIPSLLFLASVQAVAQTAPAELQARRLKAMEKCADGIILLHANAGFKHWDEFGFHQDPNFYYFTGLLNQQAAILAIDGPSKQSWLFVPPGLRSPDPDLKGPANPFLSPGGAAEAELGIEHVKSWDEFIAFLDARLKSEPKLPVYLDDGGQTGGMMGTHSNPVGLNPTENYLLLWRSALKSRWPELTIREARQPLDEIRSVKSAAEIDLLRKAAAVTADGFWAGVRSIAPGRSQRQVEADVVRGCMEAGSEGPSLWPWVRSGPMGLGSRLFAAFQDYQNLNRTMKSGEMVRLDLGCDYKAYKGDFGRTIPVSGHFDEGQAETMELLNGTYLTGLKAMKEGSGPTEVIKASIQYVREHQAGLRTEMAKTAAANALSQGNWPIHGLGLDMADGAPKTFQAGNVICYEPLFTAGDQAFFVEDTMLITHDGYEILNPPLPYSPKEIERAMANAHKSAGSRN
jgi:Xaa-Pro aminopeptidase